MAQRFGLMFLGSQSQLFHSCLELFSKCSLMLMANSNNGLFPVEVMSCAL